MRNSLHKRTDFFMFKNKCCKPLANEDVCSEFQRFLSSRLE